MVSAFRARRPPMPHPAISIPSTAAHHIVTQELSHSNRLHTIALFLSSLSRALSLSLARSLVLSALSHCQTPNNACQAMQAFILSPWPLSARRHSHVKSCTSARGAGKATMHQAAGQNGPSRRVALQLLACLAVSPFVSYVPNANARVVVADRDAGSAITETSSGLQYYDFVRGSSDTSIVTTGDMVSIHYTLGTTGARNGWRIESSEGRPPLTFRVGSGSVIKGLDEGVCGMHVGGRRRLLVPAKLGYLSKDDKPVPVGFAEFQRFKNLYLNPNIPYKPDVVFDVTVVRVDKR